MLTATPPHNNRSDKQCILLVDDSPEEQRRVLELLRPYYRTIVAFNGEQGYQRALASQPDLILMDVRMPKTDGYSACRLLKADPQTRDIPVIFLSSAHSPEERVEGLTVGGVDYVTKPYVAEEILARIRIHLDLSTRIGAVAPEVREERARNPKEIMVTAAKQLIAQHLQAPLPLAEIARRIGTYEKKLLQTFRTQTGLTVFGFIREERIRHACHLLEKTDMSILDIADQVGFQRAANFATAFRERMGMTPTTYRLSLRKDFLPDAD